MLSEKAEKRASLIFLIASGERWDSISAWCMRDVGEVQWLKRNWAGMRGQNSFSETGILGRRAWIFREGPGWELSTEDIVMGGRARSGVGTFVSGGIERSSTRNVQPSGSRGGAGGSGE